MGNKKKSFDSYSKKPLKDEVRKAMKRYFAQLDQKNMPIDVYQLVLNEVEPPLLDAVMEFTNNNQSKASRILGINRTTFRTKLKKYTKKVQLNLKDKVRKAMKGYFAQLDQKNMPIDVYQLVLNEIEPPLLDAVMRFANNNQSKAARILGINRTTFRTKLKKNNIK